MSKDEKKERREAALELIGDLPRLYVSPGDTYEKQYSDARKVAIKALKKWAGVR